jgi:protein SCO1/2
VRTVVVVALFAVFALAAFAEMTNGFRVVTSESARRLAAVERPIEVADAPLVDAAGKVHALHADLASDGRIAIVDFIYTRCESICTVLGNEFQQLQREIVAQGLQDRVRLLTISFDPAHDDPAVLAGYAKRMAADLALWRFATAADAGELAPLLASFGIVVIPDGIGGYVHNAALHVVTPGGRLARIHDLGEFRQALYDAAGLAGGARG